MTISIHTLGFAALVAVFSPAATLAKDYIPSDREQRFGQTVLREFARCVADGSPEIAHEYVMLARGERLRDNHWGALVDGNCLGYRSGSLRMNGFSLRAALAERLIDRNLIDSSPADFSAVEAFTYSDAGEDVSDDEALTYLVRLGECVARLNPQGSRHVFSTRAGSDEETAALRAIGSELATCVPAGEQVAFDRTTLRAGLATSYYRLASIAALPTTESNQ